MASRLVLGRNKRIQKVYNNQAGKEEEYDGQVVEPKAIHVVGEGCKQISESGHCSNIYNTHRNKSRIRRWVGHGWVRDGGVA